MLSDEDIGRPANRNEKRTARSTRAPRPLLCNRNRADFSEASILLTRGMIRYYRLCRIAAARLTMILRARHSARRSMEAARSATPDYAKRQGRRQR